MLLLPLCGLVSCDMDLQPEGAIPDTEALINVSDYEHFADGLNSQMRSITSGDFVILSDVQLDDFNAIIGNGNRRMEFYNGQVMPSTGEIASIYAGYYSVIAQCNFFIEHVTEKLKENLLPDDVAKLQHYAGQAYFFRAYCYSCLADKYCQSYKNCTTRDAEGTGLSLQLVYNPTADNTKYPGRSSLARTYEQILSDLHEAVNNMTEAEQRANVIKPSQQSVYPTSDAAKAMLARVCLNMGRDREAAQYAEELINAKSISAEGATLDIKRYDLLTSKKDFHDMWFHDKGSEIIWKVSADYSHTGASSGAAFCNNEQNPDYVPTNATVFLFDEDDTRWYAWFSNDVNENLAAKEKKIENAGGTATMFLFAKYPGNPALQPTGATGSNFINMGKPLRIGEMYLVAAEALHNLGEDTKAATYLADLEKARRAGGVVSGLTGEKLMQEIQNERHRELMGEGLRQADLKRWNIGFKRSNAYDGQNQVVIENYRNIEYDADDYRLTWPIPQHEIDSNPQLAGQQNPGY